MPAYTQVRLKAIQRILVIRLSSIGDILLTTPVLRLLRHHCPEAQIEFLVKAAYQDLLRTHPCVDRLRLFEPGQSWRQTLGELRQRPYDLVLDLHRTLRSRLFYHGLSARHKLAYGKHTLRRTLLVRLGWNTFRNITPVPELYAMPLRRLGIQSPLGPLEMHLDVDCLPAVQARLAHTLPDDYDGPLLALAPGARWATKRWPVTSFATVAQSMAHTHSAAVVILGGAEDRSLGQELQHRLHAPVVDCTGQLTLMQTAVLLQRCRLLISNDSGLMHMATALQVPVVALFGPTVEEFGFYPFQARARVLHTALTCRPCSTKGSERCPRGHHHCMQQLGSAQVLTAAQALWHRGNGYDPAAV